MWSRVFSVVALMAVASPPALFAGDDGELRIGVLWFPGTLGPDCPADDGEVAREVGRIYRRLGVAIEWRTVKEGDVEYHGQVILIGIDSGPRVRASVMGSTNRGSRSAWVYCSAVMEALGMRRQEDRLPLLLSRALGRVAAHEIAHVLAPSFGHSEAGLMQARWREATLREGDRATDAATRGALRARRLAPPGNPGTPAVGEPTSNPGAGHPSDVTRAGE